MFWLRNKKISFDYALRKGLISVRRVHDFEMNGSSWTRDTDASSISVGRVHDFVMRSCWTHDTDVSLISVGRVQDFEMNALFFCLDWLILGSRLVKLA